MTAIALASGFSCIGTFRPESAESGMIAYSRRWRCACLRGDDPQRTASTSAARPKAAVAPKAALQLLPPGPQRQRARDIADDARRSRDRGN